MRSKEIANTSLNLEETQFIDFAEHTTFNNIRTTYPRVPYLLQDPQEGFFPDGPRCNDAHMPPLNDGNYAECNHVLQFEDLERGWYEIVLINSNIDGASPPINQHGGWMWIVGIGQFPSDEIIITKEIIKDRFFKGELQKNTTTTTYYDGPNVFLKNVVQVPNNGYVITRSRRNNPGTWHFGSGIDFHDAIGMSLSQI